MSTDTRKRELERQVAQGDEHAQERLTMLNQRSGQGRHGDKIGDWVILAGVRDHYRGVLLGVTELGGGRAILHIAPAYWLESLADTTNEKLVPSSVEHPFDVSSEGVLGVCLQPSEWNKR